MSSYTLQRIKERGEEYRALMIGRLVSDCKYFLGEGRRNAKYLFTQSIIEQMEWINELCNAPEYSDSPRYITQAEIGILYHMMELWTNKGFTLQDWITKCCIYLPEKIKVNYKDNTEMLSLKDAIIKYGTEIIQGMRYYCENGQIVYIVLL